MKTGGSSPWTVADGHYPGFRELRGASFTVSVVMSATDVDFDTAIKREDDLQLMASAPALRDEVEALRLQLTASESLLREWVENYESADTNSFRLVQDKLDIWARTTAFLKGKT